MSKTHNALKQEKKRGKTILMSSQMFDELEETCDRVALIYDGKIIDIADVNALKSSTIKSYKIEFLDKEDYLKFKKLKYKIIRDQEKYYQVTVQIDDSEINRLFKSLSKYKLKFISEVKFNLEKHFRNILEKEVKGGKNVF